MERTLRNFSLWFEDGTSGITRHYDAEAVISVYLNQDVRKDDGTLGRCVNITEIKSSKM